MMGEEEFATRVEQLIQGSLPFSKDGELSWDNFHAPLKCLVQELLIVGGQQNSDRPGQVRIDMGELREYGGLQGNADTLLVIDFDWLDAGESLRFFAKYNLADELLRYAEVGEQGWDVARQIDQLQRTISRLKAEAAKRDWHIPDPSDI